MKAYNRVSFKHMAFSISAFLVFFSPPFSGHRLKHRLVKNTRGLTIEIRLLVYRLKGC